MSASSDDDVFVSAPDSSPSNSNLSQNQQHPLSTPLNANPDSRANQNQHLTPPPDKWLLRIASSAGQVISSVLGLSDGSSSDDESDGEVAEISTFYEEKYEFGERIKKLNQGMALDQVEEPKAIIPLIKSEKLVTRETISREQIEKPINAVQSQVVESSSPFVHPKTVSSHNHPVQVPLSPVQASLEISSVTASEAKKWSENKSISSCFTLPLNPNISPSPAQNQQPPHSSIPSPERWSKPRSKRNQPSLKCPLNSDRKKVLKKETQDLIFDPMVEEGSGAKRMPSNLKEVIELFSGDLNDKQLGDMDLLDALEMKGITFEDPPWWPK